jgi:adenylate kinase
MVFIMNIVLLGPPGIGKGTQADALAAKLRIPKICTGDIMRDEARKRTPIGRKAKSYMDRGELVPDRIVLEIMEKRLKENDCRKGFILDGFPRTLVQAKGLERVTKIDMVLNFTASEKEVLERITGRLTCKYCSEIYHSKFARPKKQGVCDKCNGELYQREDQKEDVVRRRLEVYEKQTKPLIDYYSKKGVLADVDATGSREDVSRRMLKTISDFEKRNAEE